jgi:hypothetical protein
MPSNGTEKPVAGDSLKSIDQAIENLKRGGDPSGADVDVRRDLESRVGEDAGLAPDEDDFAAGAVGGGTGLEGRSGGDDWFDPEDDATIQEPRGGVV